MAATLIVEFHWSFTKGHPQYMLTTFQTPNRKLHLLNISSGKSRLRSLVAANGAAQQLLYEKMISK